MPLQILSDHGVFVLVDAGDIDALEGGLHTDLLALPGLVGDLGGVQQRFGRDATAVQAGAADFVFLDERD